MQLKVNWEDFEDPELWEGMRKIARDEKIMPWEFWEDECSKRHKGEYTKMAGEFYEEGREYKDSGWL